jgi:hypothetical protein
MNKFYTLLVALVITANTFAQAPEKMSYQAVVRDGGDNLVTSQVVGMRISILQTTATGTAVYVETQTPTTNLNGLVTLEIGTGSTSDDFTAIDWGAGPYFIKTETDPAGGGIYTITGISQLMSVPYALYAKTAGNDVLKENTANKSIDVATDAASDVKFPSVKSVNTYVDIVQVDVDANEIVSTSSDATLQGYIDALEARLTALEPPAIGDLRAGGIVFWLDGNGGGLVCALSDYETRVQWGCSGSGLPNVPNVAYNSGNPVGSGAEIGDGMSNTNAILNDCPTAPAALAARFLGPEWFLPSINELDQMYIHKTTLGAVAGFSAFSYIYWSSTEYDSFNAWIQYVSNGGQYNDNKGTTYYVRAVRAF